MVYIFFKFKLSMDARPFTMIVYSGLGFKGTCLNGIIGYVGKTNMCTPFESRYT